MATVAETDPAGVPNPSMARRFAPEPIEQAAAAARALGEIGGQQLIRLGQTLEAISRITRDTGVILGAGGVLDLQPANGQDDVLTPALRAYWVLPAGEYRLGEWRASGSS